MVQIISPEEVLELNRESKETQETGLRILSPDEVAGVKSGMSPLDLSPSSRNPISTIGSYLKAVPATAVDITLGAGEGFASAIGEFTGDYDLARSIGAFRDDVNDAIMGDTPDDLQSDFAYKLASGLGSTLPYLGVALATRNRSLIGKALSGSFFLSSAGQQVRDDYLASQGVTSEDATDEQMSESNKAGAIGAIPIALAERLGAGLILKPFAKGAIPAGEVMKRISQYATAGAGEALTEATQSGLINYIASYVSKYDENRPITAGMAESALIGFLVGGGVNATVDTVNRRITQADRLKAGVQDGSINPKDVIDPDIGSKLTEVAMENDAIPEADTDQQKRITDPTEWRNFVSKTLTPLSRRLGRAGREIVREFRKYEMDTGIKTKELKDRILAFQEGIKKIKKTNPEDYKALSLALANANELATSLPKSTQSKLEKKSQIQPSVTLSKSEQLLNETNPEAQQINTQIEQARQALSQRGMKTRIEVVEEGSSFYDPTSNVIAISAREADGTTVAHEFFHAVLGQAVKTDAELQSMTRNMFDSVIRASVDGSSLNEQLKDFVSQYDQNIQNEEFLAQTVGELARQYQTLDLNTKTRIKVWINQAMQALGVSGIFKQAETDAEVIEQLNAFARFAGEPEVLVDGMVSKDGIDSMVNGGANEEIIGATRASKFYLKDLSEAPRVIFPKKPLRMSRITEKNQFNLAEFLKTAKEQNLNIGFWGADQSGYGTWNNPVTGENVFIDGGPSFAADPSGGIWAAAGGSKATKVDYVLQVSGHPEYMAMFNKSINSQFLKNIEKKHGSLQDFAKKYLEVMPKSKYMSALQQKMFEVSIRGDKAFSDPDRFFFSGGIAKKGKDWANTKQTKFWKDVFAQSRQYKIKDPTTQYSQESKASPLEELTDGIFPDFSTMRDEFFAKNDFKFLDIIGLIKVDGVKKGKSGHSTYPDALTGQYLGVPDIKVSVVDILSPEVVDKLQKEAEEAGKKNIPHSKFSGGAGIWTTREASDFREVTESDLQNTDKSIERKPVVSKAGDFSGAAKKLKKKQLARVRGSVNFKKWFGEGQLVHDDGEPMVLYHGTKADFSEFTSKENINQDETTPDWLYFATNPELSEEMARHKQAYRDGLDSDDRLQKLYEEFSKIDKLEGPRSGDSPMARQLREDEYIRERTGMLPETYEQYDAMSIMPVYLNAKNIWNPSNPSHVNKLMAELRKDKEWSEELDWTKEMIASGEFRYIENVPTTKALKKLGFDGAFLAETPTTGLTTVAIWDKTGVKSATGNTGAYSSSNPDIRYQKDRPASDKERIQGISDEGLRIMQKYGLTNSYTEVRNVLEQLKDEYEALGLDMNYIDNYFPRLMRDLEGFKKSIGQTVGIDEEIRRYENMTGQKLTTLERQKMYEKLARSRLYRSGQSEPSNLKERRVKALKENQLQYYEDPESALDEYVSRMVQTIETKKLIGDAQSGKTRGKEQVAGRLGEVMEKLASQGRLRQDQIDVVQGAVAARFGQHGRQYGFVKGMKNAGYLATMGNAGSAITQIGDFYFTAVQNGIIPTMQSLVGSKALTIEDLGIAKDMVTVETKDAQGFLGKSVDTVFKMTGLTAMDRLAKNTNINATYRSLQKGAKANPNSNKYKKTVNRLKRIQGNDAFKTISDLKNGVKSDLVVEAIYNELSDVAPISLTEMPESYASRPNLRILYSLKSYTIKQLNFVRERAFNKIASGIANGNPKEFAEGSVNMMKILVFGAVANGSADILKAILFNREIDEEDFWWNHILRLFGVTKYTTVTARKEGVGAALTKTIAPPQVGILNDIFKDIGKATSEEGLKINEMRSMKYVPVVGKIYYWREGKGVDVEEKLSRLREKD